MIENVLFKSLCSFFVAWVICLIIGPFLIPILRHLKFGQRIRDDGPQAHLQKAGTPTMGGLMFLAAITTAAIFFSERNMTVWILLTTTLGYGLIGFLDDFIKVVKKRPLGLRAREKLAGQIGLGLLVGLLAVTELGRGTVIGVPLTSMTWDMGWLYIPFAAFVVVSAANAVNLTDGLDGLAAGTVMFASLAYVLIGVMTGLPETAVYAGAMAGGCLGFLKFNRHPAQIFMGDTGSLALGGALAALAIITRTELVLVVIGGIFVIETLSVILQVISFRLTGRRIFLMSPLHHHFELAGWSEKRVVYTFWALAAVLAILGILSLHNFPYEG
ncbi:MAG: phospho-N-acetylmuramoyl-pentapeptide-transferase [Firmicutes bacterium]|nr:phospho-N-acetylmuramoyl-pentapeptide-transferase [Bacillota bacterium]